MPLSSTRLPPSGNPDQTVLWAACFQSMADCLRHFAARKEHQTSDSTFVVLMSHGLRDGVCGVDCQGQNSDLLSIDTVFATFNNRNCQALRGKPKVIIIQACRGGMLNTYRETGALILERQGASLENVKHKKPKETEMLIFWCCCCCMSDTILLPVFFAVSQPTFILASAPLPLRGA